MPTYLKLSLDSRIHSPKSVVGDWVAGENMTDAEAFSINWDDTSDERGIGLLLEKWLHPYGVGGWCEFS
ncbi:hypothetical protein D3C79_1075680 [compost metagenome]